MEVTTNFEESTQTALAVQQGGKWRIRRARKLATGLLALVLVGSAVWRGAHAQSQIGPPPMPLAYEFIASPNFGERPANTPVNFMVLHSTVEPTTEGTIGIFLNPARQVSAHFVVGKDGRVVQMVPIEKRAWHAGVSTWDGVKDLNNVSVGIEMVNLNDGKDPYTEPQIQAVAGIIRFVRSRYLIPDDHIVSHAQIAIPPGRKSDPLGFDFDRIKLLARVQPAAPAPANTPAPNAAPLPAPLPANPGTAAKPSNASTE